MIFISSVVGLTGSAGQANYAASKAGLVGLARSIARELGCRGITANVVAPGFVDTDMTARAHRQARARRPRVGPAGPLRHGRRRSPPPWPGSASDAAAYVTGAVIPVDGGLGMGH